MHAAPLRLYIPLPITKSKSRRFFFFFLFNYFSFGCLSCTRIDLADGSIIKKYLDSARSLSYEERGKLLESDTAFTAGHQELALEGQTEANPDVRVYHHFIALVHKDGKLLELDGRKSFPVQHGATTEETLLVVSLRFIFIFLPLLNLPHAID